MIDKPFIFLEQNTEYMKISAGQGLILHRYWKEKDIKPIQAITTFQHCLRWTWKHAGNSSNEQYCVFHADYRTLNFYQKAQKINLLISQLAQLLFKNNWDPKAEPTIYNIFINPKWMVSNCEAGSMRHCVKNHSIYSVSCLLQISSYLYGQLLVPRTVNQQWNKEKFQFM